jgi:outer membrane protein TolC
MKSSLFALIACLFTGAAIPTLAQDSIRSDELSRNAVKRFDRARRVNAQGNVSTAAPVDSLVDMTLDEATTRALERNLELAVERLNPQAFDFSIASIEAAYHPTITSQLGLRNSTTFSRSQTAGADVLESANMSGNVGLSQNIKQSGANFSVTFNNNRIKQTDSFALRNPTLNTSFNAVLVQPLMRGFRVDGTRTQLIVTKLNQDMSELALRGTVVATLSDVRNTYWDLVYAVQTVEVARRSLELASKLVEDNRVRVEVGTLAPIDVVQAQAEEALRRQTLVQAEGTSRTAELALKRLLVSGTDDPLWSATINPVDRPLFSAEPLDVEGAVGRALENRTDLQQSRKRLESNDLTLINLSNQRLPALDLTASYGASGIGGPQFVRSGLGGAVTQTVPSGWGDALSTLGHLTAPQWNLALNLSYPLGASSAEANHARALVQKRQTVAQEKQLELQIATEVTNAAIQADSNLTQYQAALASRNLAQQRLDAEQSKFEVGISTNFFVVQAQRDLADAQNAELRAVLEYRKALVDFQRVQEAPAGGRAAGGITTVTGG